MNREEERENQRIVQDILGDFENEFFNDLNASRGNAQVVEREKQNDLIALQEAWVKEKTVPDILPYEESLIERVLQRIRKQLEFIEMNSIELQTHEKDIKLMLVIVETELERIQFLIRSYVRLRLQKIDRYSLFIQQNQSELDKLNRDEVTYMEGHLAMLHELFKEQYLKKLPKNSRILEDGSSSSNGNIGEDQDMVDAPNLDNHVFLRCTGNTGTTVGSGDNREDLIMRSGEVYVMRYKSIAKVLANNEAVII